MPGAERHVLSVQMSSLCRHNESYKHKYASRQGEKVIRSQIVTNSCLEEIPNY